MRSEREGSGELEAKGHEYRGKTVISLNNTKDKGEKIVDLELRPGKCKVNKKERMVIVSETVIWKPE